MVLSWGSVIIIMGAIGRKVLNHKETT